MLNALSFLNKFLGGDVDLGLRVGGDGKSLNDGVSSVLCGAREGEDETLGNIVRTIRCNTHRDPVLRAKSPISDVVNSCITC